MKRLIPVLLLLSSLSLAATYNIGPGKTYTTIGAAPWSSLTAGDVVNIYPKTAITATTASASTGTTITLSSSAGSIPYGSTVWFAGYTAIMPWVTCGTYGSGLYGTATAGTVCSGNTVTISNAVSIGSGVTVYFTPPYFEKMVLAPAGLGTAGSPIVVQGVPDPTTGALPILDSHNATTGPNMAHTGSTTYHDAYGFVLFVKNTGQTAWPKYLTLKNVRIQGGRSGLTGFDGTNASYTYTANSGIRFEYAENVTIEANEIVDSDNGLFGADNPGLSPAFVIKSLTVRGNHFWQNGKGSGSHQSYMEAQGIIYEQNWYDAPATGTSCSQLKDRSSGMVVRYNLFYPSIRIFDFVAAQNSIGDTAKPVSLTVPAGGFATGATSLTFGSSVSGINVGDRVGLVSAFTGVYASSIVAGNPTVLRFSASYISGGASPGMFTRISGATGTGCSMLNGVQAITARDGTSGDVTINVDSTGCSYTANSAAIHTGWGYPGSGFPIMPTVSAVNTGTNTLTLNAPGLPLGVKSGATLVVLPRTAYPYLESFVYGNILDMDASLYGSAQGALVHYGWDTAGGIDSVYDRAGTLYFYHNTVLVRGTTGTGLFQTESESDTIRADNNLFYIDPSFSASFTALTRSQYVGLITATTFGGGKNLVVTNASIGSNTCNGITLNGWKACDGTYPLTSGTSIDLSNWTAITATQAYPLGISGRNYGLQSGSSAVGAATSLPAAIASNTLGMDLTPTSQYGGTARTSLTDVGAFQYSAATMSSIAVTPSTASILAGATRQFTCTATWSDSSTTDCSSSATWTSSATAKATVSTTGLATGVAVGSASIAATVGSFTSMATLTVTPPPPSTVIETGGIWTGITIQ